MKNVIIFLVIASSLFSNELIHISNEATKLNSFYTKYKQNLIIDNNHVYLIPKECKLERYFGGASQGQLELVEGPVHTDEIIITQEVFEAKDAQDIQKKINIDKSISLVQGKVAKEFLDDDEGRGFGGASEVGIDYSFQKTKHKQENSISNSEVIIQEDEASILPTCELLEDGSGYQLHNLKDAKLYNGKILSTLTTNKMLFK